MKNKWELTIALPKGRLLDEALVLLKKIGINAIVPSGSSRELIFFSDDGRIRFIILRAVDVPTYVEYGAADMGIAGKDILVEQGRDVYEPVDLKTGFCRLIVAEPVKLKEKDNPLKWTNIRIATKYPNITERYFGSRGVQVEIIKLYGSIELAPIVSLSERIVDLVSTGETLRANGLTEVEEIMPSTARLIVNRASLKLKMEAIGDLITKLKKVLRAGGAV